MSGPLGDGRFRGRTPPTGPCAGVPNARHRRGRPQPNAAHGEATSEAYRAFTADLRRVAGSQVTVLIEGEPGSGKSLALPQPKFENTP